MVRGPKVVRRRGSSGPQQSLKKQGKITDKITLRDIYLENAGEIFCLSGIFGSGNNGFFAWQAVFG